MYTNNRIGRIAESERIRCISQKVRYAIFNRSGYTVSVCQLEQWGVQPERLAQGLKSVRYGVSKVLDMAYWEFLGAHIRRIFLDGYNVLVVRRFVQLILFIVDSGCTKHMTGNLKLLCNFVEKYLDLQGNDLLTGNRGSDLYTISLQETTSSTPICLMAKASPTQAWLWHRRLFHFNFDHINLLSKKDVVIGLVKLKYVKDQLCSSCEVINAKRSSFKTKVVLSSKEQLNLLHMNLCDPMRVASINGKKYIQVIVDGYARYTWTLFLRSKDETPEVLKDFLTMLQQNLQALVNSVRTNRGTEFLNKTLHAFFKEEGIDSHTSPRRKHEA
ncbi:retrovirus-related pol polyprotein from transposon TNT 1-94 [Tanacetum coccineum]